MDLNRRTFLRAAGLTTFGLAAGGTLASCSNGGAAAKPTGKLSYPSWMWGEAGVGDYWKATVAEFQKQHADVTVSPTTIPANEYQDKITTQLAAGQSPDILPVFTNQIYQLIDNDMLAPLDDRLAKTDWVGKELPLFGASQKDGKHYGVVLTASPWGFIYNKKILEAAGADLPTTPDELLTSVTSIKAKTGNWGMVLPTDPSQTLQAYISTMHFVLGFGSDWATADGTPTANTAKTVEAMEFMQELINAKIMPNGQKFLDARNLYKDGKVAYAIDVPTTMTLVKKENAELYPHLGYTSSPTPTKAAVTGGAFFTLPKDSPNNDLAWEYIKLVNQPEWQARWLTDTVQLAGQNVKPSAEFIGENPWVTDMLDVAAKYQVGFGYAPPSKAIAPKNAEFQKIVVDHVSQIWNRSAQVKPQLDKLQGALESWVKSNGIK